MKSFQFTKKKNISLSKKINKTKILKQIYINLCMFQPEFGM